MLTPRLDNLDRNFLINGNFDFWQRNTSFASIVQFGYYADRWANQSAANVSASVSRQLSGLQNSIYCLRWLAGSVTSRFNMTQALEGAFANDLKGKSATASLKIRVNAGNVRPYRIRVYTNSVVNTLTGGAFVLLAETQDISPTLSFQTFSLNFTVPNDGTANGFRVEITDTVSGLATDYVEITDFMIVESFNSISNVPSSYVRAGRDYKSEFDLCLRYYEAPDGGAQGNNILVRAQAGNNQALQPGWTWIVPKRAVPVVRVGYLGVLNSVRDATGGGSVAIIPTTFVVSEFTFDALVANLGPFITDKGYQFNYDADAEIN